jgi:hypothetical protein
LRNIPSAKRTRSGWTDRDDRERIGCASVASNSGTSTSTPISQSAANAHQHTGFSYDKRKMVKYSVYEPESIHLQALSVKRYCRFLPIFCSTYRTQQIKSSELEWNLRWQVGLLKAKSHTELQSTPLRPLRRRDFQTWSVCIQEGAKQPLLREAEGENMFTVNRERGCDVSRQAALRTFFSDMQHSANKYRFSGALASSSNMYACLTWPIRYIHCPRRFRLFSDGSS